MRDDGPDTEPSDPPTRSSEAISVDVDFSAPDTEGSPDTRQTAPPTLQDGGVVSKEIATETTASLQRTRATKASQNTTLQSMKKPEISPGSVPHSRRFLSIEYELSDLSVAMKVLQKRLDRAEKNTRIAWIVGGVATLLAAAALAL